MTQIKTIERIDKPLKPTSLCIHCVNCNEPLEHCEGFERKVEQRDGYLITLQCSGYRKQS